MANKEATSRIKINKLLEAAGWRFFPEGSLRANFPLNSPCDQVIRLEALGETSRSRAGALSTSCC